MTAFRVIDPFQVFFDLQGRVAASGSLKFYEAGTTTPQDVYGDQALTVDNGSTIALGVDGRPVDDVWGSGSYRVRAYASDGTLIIDRDNIEIPGGSGTAIPALLANQFLTNDGAVLLWSIIRQLPDPTGQSDKVLSNDGENFTWIAKPADGASGTSDLAVTDSSFLASDGALKFLVQSGNASAPNTGSRDTQVDVTFDTAFASAPMAVLITPVYTGNVSQYGTAPVPHVSTKSASGFTVNFAGSERDDSNSGYNFNTTIPFDWIAIGVVDA